MRTARYILPFAVAAALFGAILLLLIRHGLHQDSGVFVYPLDDAYIHMAVSRNVALHDVWGVTPYGFSGASSSPGWTLLLAAVSRVAGVHLLTPLVLNTLAALLLLLVAGILLARALPLAGALYRTFYCAGALCVLVLVMPLPGLVLIGMEHVLHSVAVLCLMAAAASIASLSPGTKVGRGPAGVLVCAGLACGALRYESCFVVAVVLVVLLLCRRFGLASLLALAAAASPVWYGLYSYKHSGILLPFSVVMKSAGAGSLNPLSRLFDSDVSPMVLLLAAVLLLQLAQHAGQPEASRESFWTFIRSFLVIALSTTVLHAEFGPAGWLMRYEAYLYAFGVLALAIGLSELPPFSQNAKGGGHLNAAPRWVGLAIVFSLMPAGLALVHRAHHGWSDFSASIHDRYVEHLPQALFVEREMPHSVVVANDIGFLAFYADQAAILDPLGLGSIEPVRLERASAEASAILVLS